MLGQTSCGQSESLFFQNDNEMPWLMWVLAGMPWQHHLIGNNTCYQVWKTTYRNQICHRVSVKIYNFLCKWIWVVEGDKVGDKVGTKTFARLYVGVPVTDEMEAPKGGTIINDRFMSLNITVKYSWFWYRWINAFMFFLSEALKFRLESRATLWCCQVIGFNVTKQ